MTAGESSRPADLCVIGAGWSGLAAAVSAASAGLTVRLIDAARQAGGRARSQSLDLGFGPVVLDNGQHLLMGAYRDTLRLIDMVSPHTATYSRKPFRLRDTSGLDLRAGRYPAPWHLLAALAGAQGLSLAQRFAATRLMTALRLSGWRALPGETVDQMLVRHRQPEPLCERLWRPLCLSALNTASANACARTLVTILRDTLGSDASACDFIIPHTSLGDCLPRPALTWLAARDITPEWSVTARSLRAGERGWTIVTREQTIGARSLILALPPAQAARLLESFDHAGLTAIARRWVSALSGLAPAPITTVYAAWPTSALPALPDWLMLNSSGPGEWLFDRGVHRDHRIAAIVASGCDAQGHGSPSAFAREIAGYAARAAGLPAPRYAEAIVEKRATFSCVPDRPRIDQPEAGHLPGLWLAGDYTEAWYPATLESAVRSGSRAAHLASHWLVRQA